MFHIKIFPDKINKCKLHNYRQMNAFITVRTAVYIHYIIMKRTLDPKELSPRQNTEYQYWATYRIQV